MRGEKNIIWKIMVYFLVFFFIITTSIWVHELIHVYQLSKNNQHVDEVCLMGWKTTKESSAVGWVKSLVHKELEEKKMEDHALLVQVFYVTATALFFTKLA